MLVIDETALPKKGSHVSIGCSVARNVTRLSFSSWTMLCGSRNDRARRSMHVTTRASPGRRKSIKTCNSVRPSRRVPLAFSARSTSQPAAFRRRAECRGSGRGLKRARSHIRPSRCGSGRAGASVSLGSRPLTRVVSSGKYRPKRDAICVSFRCLTGVFGNGQYTRRFPNALNLMPNLACWGIHQSGWNRLASHVDAILQPVTSPDRCG